MGWMLERGQEKSFREIFTVHREANAKLRLRKDLLSTPFDVKKIFTDGL
jgi:hypothetical protein